MKKKFLYIDCQNANASGSGGAGVYTENLINYLNQNQQALNVSLHLDNLPGENNNHLKVTLRGIARDLAQYILPSKAYEQLISLYKYLKTRKSQLTQIKLPKDSNNFESNSSQMIIAHEVTNYSVHPQYAVSKIKSNLKLVATFLDVQDFFYPEFFSDTDLLSRRQSYSFFKEYGDHFIAISEYTKSTMVEILKIPAEKISVVYLGYDVSPPTPDVEFEQKIAEFGRYLIYPAKLWMHKNHQGLFEAMSECKHDLRKAKVTLILTGGFKSLELRKLKAELHRLGIEDLVLPMGFLSHNSLKLLISKAEFLIFPSLFEGFGMPVIEAMQLGCPVLSSNTSSLPEVCGDAAILFDPRNQSEIKDVLLKVARQEIDRKSLIQKGLQHSGRFTWEKCMQQTVKVYEKLWSSPP